MKKLSLLLGFAALVFLVVMSAQSFLSKKDLPVSGERKVVLGKKEISVLVVDTPELRAKGLGGRESLPPDTGMFFVFSETSNHGIWMKDMLFAIDILWIDENGLIVDIAPSIGPETFPEIFEPRAPARYVLELPAGFAQKENIALGDMLVFKSKNEGPI